MLTHHPNLPHPHPSQDKYTTAAANGRGPAWRAGGLISREALAECVERHLSLRCVPVSQGGGRVSPVMILSSSSSALTPPPSRLLSLQGCGQAALLGVGAKRQQQRQEEEKEEEEDMTFAAMIAVSP